MKEEKESKSIEENEIKEKNEDNLPNIEEKCSEIIIEDNRLKKYPNLRKSIPLYHFPGMQKKSGKLKDNNCLKMKIELSSFEKEIFYKNILEMSAQSKS